MGDARHKKSPPPGKAEDVTPLFVKRVAAALAYNDAFNTQHKLRKGDPGYRIAQHADLAEAVDCDPNLIKNMLGGVRAGTKTKVIGRSKYVVPIREVLGIPAMATILVPENRRGFLQRLADLPDSAFDEYERRVAELEARGLDRDRDGVSGSAKRR